MTAIPCIACIKSLSSRAFSLSQRNPKARTTESYADDLHVTRTVKIELTGVIVQLVELQQ